MVQERADEYPPPFISNDVQETEICPLEEIVKDFVENSLESPNEKFNDPNENHSDPSAQHGSYINSTLYEKLFDDAIKSGEGEQPNEALDENDIPGLQHDMEDLRETFGHIAGVYIRPVRHFLTNLKSGPSTCDWLDILVPSLNTVADSAMSMGLENLSNQFNALKTTLEEACNNGSKHIDGEVREKILKAYQTLSQECPEAFGAETEGDQKDSVILHSLLRQIPGIGKTALDKIMGVGLTSINLIARASKEELSAATGISEQSCEEIINLSKDYFFESMERMAFNSPSEWLDVLAPVVSELEKFHRARETNLNLESEERIRLRWEREKAALNVHILLAEMGRLEILQEIQKLSFDRRIDRLREFMASLRGLSRDELTKKAQAGQSLENIDLREAQLEGISLTGANLTGADLSGANLSGADLRDANLTASLLRETFFTDANLDGANLSNAKMEGANFLNASLRKADLSGADLEGANLEGVNLSQGILKNASLLGANLGKAVLDRANLRAANLTGAYLGGAVLCDADLRGAIVEKANLEESDLRRADLRECLLDSANLSRANLDGSLVGEIKARVNASINISRAESEETDNTADKEDSSAEAEQSQNQESQISTDEFLEEKDEIVGLSENTIYTQDADSAILNSANDDLTKEESRARELQSPNIQPQDIQNDECSQKPTIAPESQDKGPQPEEELSFDIEDEILVAQDLTSDAVPVQSVYKNQKQNSRIVFLSLLLAAAAIGAVLFLWFQGSLKISESITPQKLLTIFGRPEEKTQANEFDSPNMETKIQPTQPPAMQRKAESIAKTPTELETIVEEKINIQAPPEPAPKSKSDQKPPVNQKVETKKTAAGLKPVKTKSVSVKNEEKASIPKDVEGAKTGRQQVELKKEQPGKEFKMPTEVEAAPKELRKTKTEIKEETKSPTATSNQAPTTNLTAAKQAPEPIIISQEKSQTVKEELPETIIISDNGLELCIRKALSTSQGVITMTQAANLTELSCSNPNSDNPDVKELSGIEHFINLAKLDLSYNQVVDIAPLAKLKKLESLNLRANKISDIGSVTKFSSQCEIDLINNPIEDITPLLMRGKPRRKM